MKLINKFSKPSSKEKYLFKFGCAHKLSPLTVTVTPTAYSLIYFNLMLSKDIYYTNIQPVTSQASHKTFNPSPFLFPSDKT